MALVPRVFVHAGLRRTETVCPGQRQLGAGDGRTDPEEVDGQLGGRVERTLAPFQVFFFFVLFYFQRTCTYFPLSVSSWFSTWERFFFFMSVSYQTLVDQRRGEAGQDHLLDRCQPESNWPLSSYKSVCNCFTHKRYYVQYIGSFVFFCLL